MLEEHAASLVLTAGAPATGCPPPPPSASQEVEASLVDTCSPAKGALWTTDSPLLSLVQGQPQGTPPGGWAQRQGCRSTLQRHPPRHGPSHPALGDTTTDAVNRNPSPQTTLAERQLKRFTERIQKPRQPPLLELPIEDKTYGRYAPPSFLMWNKQIAV
jgi:hypothetical protein